MRLTACWVLTENNDWEGEVWNFYVPVEGNEDAIGVIEEFLGRLRAEFEGDGSGGDFPYEVQRQDFHLPTVAKMRGGGYMAEHNVLEKLDLAKVRAVDWAQVRDDGSGCIHDHLYKGGLRDLVTGGAL